MVGAFGGSLCMWFIGAYIKLSDPAAHTTNTGLSSGGIAAIFFFYLWTAFYTPSWNGTPWVINSEIFSQNTRWVSCHFFPIEAPTDQFTIDCSAKPQLQPITGSGTSSSPDSPPRCS
jgi:hypothetical protein